MPDTPSASSPMIRLQQLRWYGEGRESLYLHRTDTKGPAPQPLPQTDEPTDLSLVAHQIVALDGYHNQFAQGLWNSECALHDMSLGLCGQGRIRVQICGQDAQGRDLRDQETVLELQENRPQSHAPSAEIRAQAVILWPEFSACGPMGTAPLPAAPAGDHAAASDTTTDPAIVALRHRGPMAPAKTPDGDAGTGAHSPPVDARLSRCVWQTRTPPRQRPDLAIIVTTFRREAQARALCARLAPILSAAHECETDQAPHANPHIDTGHARLWLIDNGCSLTMDALPKGAQCVTNPNLGGSGGFARGLIEARHAQATHCLFMDDDASADPEAIARTHAYLAYAKDPNLAVAGALSRADQPHILWENTAHCDLFCRPQYCGTDLSQREACLGMLRTAHHTHVPGVYGGWWFFAFSLQAVHALPFPFFIRGDDVGFSLANTLRVTSLPGVIATQEVDFGAKETPLTGYLELRSHLVHQLGLPLFTGSRRNLWRIAFRFWARALVMYRYETIQAMTWALQDVCAGPQAFAAAPDLAMRRAQISLLTQNEAPRALNAHHPAPRTDPRPPASWQSRLGKISLNGHLTGAISLWGRDETLPPEAAGQATRIWGARKITQITADRHHAVVLHARIWRGWRASLGFWRQMLRLIWRRGTLHQDWQAGYHRLTTQSYWEDTLKAHAPMEPPAPAPAASAPSAPAAPAASAAPAPSVPSARSDR